MIESDLFAEFAKLRRDLDALISTVRAPGKVLCIAEYARERGISKQAMGLPWNVPYFKKAGTRHTRDVWNRWHSIPVEDRRKEWDLMPLEERTA